METKFCTVEEVVINRRHYWLHLITCEIGYISVVQYEKEGFEIETFTYYNNYEKANKKFTQLIGKAVKAMSK